MSLTDPTPIATRLRAARDRARLSAATDSPPPRPPTAAVREAPSGFPALLRGYRVRAGLSQAQLAARLAVTAGEVSRWESGQRGIRPEMARCLASALDLSPAEWRELATAAGFAVEAPAPTPRVREAPEVIDPLARELSRYLRDEAVPEDRRQGVRGVVAMTLRLARAAGGEACDG